MEIVRETAGIGRLLLGVFITAAFAGLSTVVLPLLLDERGATKPEIVVFYVLFATLSMGAILTGGGWCRRTGRYRSGIAFGATLGLAGMALLTESTPDWAIYPAACCTAFGSLIYPSFVALLDNGALFETRVITLVRTVFIIGYLAGLGLTSAMFIAEETLGPPFHPIHAGMALYGLTLLVSTTLPAIHQPQKPVLKELPGHHRKQEWWLVALAIAAVFLLCGAHNLRQVYLPLYAQDAGMAACVIPSLFALTATVEILILTPLTTATEKYGSVRTIVVGCVLGSLSFLLLAVDTGYGGLLTAQVFYAVFIAGVQSIIVVMLGQITHPKVAGGISGFVAIFHLGAVLGVIAPLAVPGYSVAIFWIGCGWCLLAAAAVVAAGGDLDARSEAAEQSSRAEDTFKENVSVSNRNGSSTGR